MDQFIQRVIKVLARVSHTIIDAFEASSDVARKEAVEVLDTLGGKYLPMAMKHVQDLAASDLSSEEKRSVAFTKISQELQSDGQDAMASGFNSFVNLLIELAINALKSLAGQSLGSSPAAIHVATLEKQKSSG